MKAFTLLVALSLIGACGEDSGPLPIADAGPDATPVDCAAITYDNFEDSFFEEYCRDCHLSSLSGSERKGASVGIDFDNHDLVSMFSFAIKRTAGEGITMPPSFAQSRPSTEERSKLTTWIRCGLP